MSSGTLKLHGFSASNYYNVVKLALLEKDLPFEDVRVYTGAGPRYRPDYLAQSPLGKVPCLETEQGFLSESRCILEYLEDAYPVRPLFPQDAFGRAKLRELTQIIDLYLELPARRVIGNYFARRPAPERVANEIREVLGKGANAVRVLARFDDFLLGDRFSAADIAATIHFPMVRAVVKGVLAYDPLADIPGLDAYLARMEQRATVQRVRADQSANGPEFTAHLGKLYGFGA